MQNLMLVMKMASFFDLRTLGGVGSFLKFGILNFACQTDRRPSVKVRLPRNFRLLGLAQGAIAWHAKFRIANFICNFKGFWSYKSKTKSHFWVQ